MIFFLPLKLDFEYGQLLTFKIEYEISRITKFILDRGAVCTLKIRGQHYRRSPLVQGGLEVPCEITISMIGSVVNHLLLVRYEKLLKELYTEPKEEEIVATFLSLEPNKLAEREQSTRQRPTVARKSKGVSSRDIRDMLKNGNKKDNSVIIID